MLSSDVVVGLSGEHSEHNLEKRRTKSRVRARKPFERERDHYTVGRGSGGAHNTMPHRKGGAFVRGASYILHVNYVYPSPSAKAMGSTASASCAISAGLRFARLRMFT